MKTFNVSTSKRNEMIDITSKVKKAIDDFEVKDGVCILYVPHTTAGITINESADPAVKKDIKQKLKELVPANAGYSHREGNADSHIKSSMIGCSERVILSNGKLNLGTWQGIFFCEFDGPRSRKVFVEILEK